MKPYITGIIIGVMGFIAFKQCDRATNTSTSITKSDTIYLHTYDTIRIKEPIYISSRVIDTMIVILSDTLLLRDTLYLPIEQKVYKDSNYTAWVSGYHPKLDSIYIRENTLIKEVKNVYKPKRWGIGLQLGYGYNGLNVAPYVGVGVSYNFIKF